LGTKIDAIVDETINENMTVISWDSFMVQNFERLHQKKEERV
jgi:hypothetical protein